MIAVNGDNLEDALQASIEIAQRRKAMATATNGSLNGAGMGIPVATPAANERYTQHDHTARTVPPELVRALYAPLPPEAIAPHPSKAYLSSVKAIFVVERLNEVFGIGGWSYTTKVVESGQPTTGANGKERPGMIVVRVIFRVKAYGIRLEQFGGSDNEDRGDAYKGAVTDALSKIGSYLGIAIDVYKGGGPTKVNPRGSSMPRPQMATPPAAPTTTAATRDRQPAPWVNRGQMKEAFARIRERVGELTYLKGLDMFGGNLELNWKSSNQALDCYEWLVEQAVS